MSELPADVPADSSATGSSAQPDSSPDLQSPSDLTELCELVRCSPRCLAVGGRSKPPLSSVGIADGRDSEEDVRLISMQGLSGIIEYEPSEFTFTAMAGTPVGEVAEVLHQRGQYLPFDPMLLEAGSTLGGCVASGLSGPGRFRFGGVRDFLLGTTLVTGQGEVIRAGGKVVKNAAGFDIPKLMVGSLGRLGILTELSFKVFPEPPQLLTFKIPVETASLAVDVITAAASARWELDAIDYCAASSAPTESAVYVRLGGPAAGNEKLGREIIDVLGRIASCRVEQLQADAASPFWNELRELRWCAADDTVVKVPITGKQFVLLASELAGSPGIPMNLSVGGSLAWIAVSERQRLSLLEQKLGGLGLTGLVVRGDCRSIYLSPQSSPSIAAAIRQAMDSQGRFPPYPSVEET